MIEYDDGRIWYRKKGKVITMGLTEKAFEEIGEVDGITLPTEGDELNQDDVLGEISGTRTSFEVISPVDGLVISVNDELNGNFDLLSEDPLDEGWLCQIKMDAAEETESEEESEASESE
jgi:glycine cleavage system H protein